MLENLFKREHKHQWIYHYPYNSPEEMFKLSPQERKGPFKRSCTVCGEVDKNW